MTSEASAQERPLRLRATAALVRAVLVGGLALVAAVVVGRPQLLLAAVPLTAWAVLAVARHLGRGEDQDLPAPVLRTSGRVIEESGGVTVAVEAPAGLLVTAAVPTPVSARVTPRDGSVTAAGTARLRLTSRRWGELRIGPAHVLVADPFGAHRDQRRLPEATVRVVPDSQVLDAPVEVPSPIGISGVHLSRRRGDGTALSEVREFRPGDRLHRINWRVTNRTGTLHTNATFTEQDTEVLIVTDTTLDVAPAPWTEPGTPSSLDMTVRATTAIARHYLTIGDRVALLDLGHLIGAVPPGSGPRHLRVIVSALSGAARDDGQLRRVNPVRSVRPGTLAVVCSPLLSDEVLAQVGRLVALGADVIVVDTLPPSVGDHSVLRGRPVRTRSTMPERFWPEAWTLRRLLREGTVQELRQQGVPVTPWTGPSSLGHVLLALSVASSAPRLRRS